MEKTTDTFTYTSDEYAHKQRRRFINQGRTVSLVIGHMNDNGTMLYTFDVWR